MNATYQICRRALFRRKCHDEKYKNIPRKSKIQRFNLSLDQEYLNPQHPVKVQFLSDQQRIKNWNLRLKKLYFICNLFFKKSIPDFIMTIFWFKNNLFFDKERKAD
ncbi:hypothetical protein GS19_05305 [Acinetobacter idrijaensis]|nr:hypothetical protein GS19_05305 [Acinetobacter idrijaensis]